jgi:hypothetical protein
MQSRKYDHCFDVEDYPMKEEIDVVLARLKGSIVQTRFEFLRMAAAYSLASVLHRPRIESGGNDENHEKLV